jgi:branched-chain amino acid transport system permease protein
MCLFGGRGTIFGPVLGATLLSLFQEWAWARFLYIHEAIFGAIIVFVILLMPRGILGVLQQRYRLPRIV